MKLLLDTHVFIWSFSDVKRLKKNVAIELQDPKNIVYVSVASIWEMQIKLMLKKMKFDEPLRTILVKQENNGIEILDVESSHALAIADLSFHHKDPFDRMLIAQAMVEDMTLISADRRFADYEVKLLEW